MPGIEIVTQPSDWQALRELSRTRPVWLLKHSTTCGISAAARREYERFAATAAPGEAPRFALVEVQPSRALCRQIAAETGIPHESPQVLLLRGGEVVWNASHWGITTDALARAGRPV
jgi:bacillithiol system protein YtxJ